MSMRGVARNSTVPNWVETVVICVGLVNLLAADGESTWFERAQLLATYLILAAAFFVYP